MISLCIVLLHLHHPAATVLGIALYFSCAWHSPGAVEPWNFLLQLRVRASNILQGSVETSCCSCAWVHVSGCMHASSHEPSAVVVGTWRSPTYTSSCTGANCIIFLRNTRTIFKTTIIDNDPTLLTLTPTRSIAPSRSIAPHNPSSRTSPHDLSPPHDPSPLTIHRPSRCIALSRSITPSEPISHSRSITPSRPIAPHRCI